MRAEGFSQGWMDQGLEEGVGGRGGRTVWEDRRVLGGLKEL